MSSFTTSPRSSATAAFPGTTRLIGRALPPLARSAVHLPAWGNVLDRHMPPSDTDQAFGAGRTRHRPEPSSVARLRGVCLQPRDRPVGQALCTSARGRAGNCPGLHRRSTWCLSVFPWSAAPLAAVTPMAQPWRGLAAESSSVDDGRPLQAASSNVLAFAAAPSAQLGLAVGAGPDAPNRHPDGQKVECPPRRYMAPRKWRRGVGLGTQPSPHGCQRQDATPRSHPLTARQDLWSPGGSHRSWRNQPMAVDKRPRQRSEQLLIAFGSDQPSGRWPRFSAAERGRRTLIRLAAVPPAPRTATHCSFTRKPLNHTPPLGDCPLDCPALSRNLDV